MSFIFFLKMFKIESSSPNCDKKFGKSFFVSEIIASWNKLSQLRREYLWSAVNILTKSPKIWHITKREFLQLNCVHSDQEIWQWCCCWDINSVSASLPCYLSKGPMKGDFLDFYLSTFFGVCKLKNPSGMRVIVFLTSNIFFQKWITTSKMQKKM